MGKIKKVRAGTLALDKGAALSGCGLVNIDADATLGGYGLVTGQRIVFYDGWSVTP